MAFDIRTARPVRRGGFDMATAKPVESPSFSDKVKTFGLQLGEVFKQQGKGALRSFGVDTRIPEETFADQISGSVMATPQQKAGALSRKIGGYTGDLITLIFSEATAGAPASALVAKYGFGPVRAAFTQGALTGITYEGIRGAFQNREPMETVSEMGKSGLAFGGLNVASYPILKAGQYLTQNAPEMIANQYLNPRPTVAQNLRLEGKPSLGKQFLEKTDYGIGQSQDTVYNKIARELEENNMLVQNALEKRAQQARTPNVPEVKIEGTPQLEYKPTEIKQINPENISGQFPYTGTLSSGESAGLKGERIILEPKIQTPGTDYQTFISGKGSGPFTRFEGVGTMPTNPKSNFEEMAASLNPLPSRMAAPIKKGPIIDLDEIRSTLQGVIKEQTNIGRTDTAKAVSDLTSEFAPGEKIIDLRRANQLRQELDAEVNNAYLKTPNNIPPATEARADLANALRASISKQAPEVSAILNRNHFLLNTKSALLPQVSGTAPIKGYDSGILRSMARGIIGNRVGLGVARGLENIGKNKALPQAYKQGTRLGLAEYLER